MFFFESMFNTALAGLDAGGALIAIKTTAMAIILACALFGVYEAFARGGDTRALATTGIKYLVMGFALTFYQESFRSLYQALTDVAHTIAVNDVWDEFRAQFQNYLEITTSSFWNLVLGTPAGTISLVFQFIAMIVFPVACALFSLLYSLYGAVLYATGPLVLALYPAMGVSHLARTYLTNLVIFFGWGVIYAVFCRVMMAVNADSLNDIVNAGNFGSFFEGSAQALLLAASSILYSLMILLIPFIAKRVVSGDVGSSMMSVVGTAVAAATMAGSAGLGAFGGTFSNSAASSETGAPGGAGSGGPAASAGMPPPHPSRGGSAQAPNAPHNSREWGNYNGWANLPPAHTGSALNAMKQAPADLRSQPMWRVGSPAEVRQMAESGDWSQAYAHVVEAHTAGGSSAGTGRFTGSYAGDFRAGRNWSHAAGWAAGRAMASGFRTVRSAFAQQTKGA